MAALRDAQPKLDSTDANEAEQTKPSIEEILRGTAHAMTIFNTEEKTALEAGLFLKKAKPYLKCYVTGKDRERPGNCWKKPRRWSRGGSSAVRV